MNIQPGSVISASGNPSGIIAFADIPLLMKQADRYVAAGQINLSEVVQMDSAGLAYLLELTRRARDRKQAFSLFNANAQIRDIARFFDLDSILRFAD